jgi:hypothetical protein
MRFSALFTILLPGRIAYGFSPAASLNLERCPSLKLSATNSDQDLVSTQASSRRDFFQSLATTVALGTVFSQVNPQVSNAAEASSKNKILVLGGTGFVGSRVVQQLQDRGYSVISTSRDGRDGTVQFDATSSTDVTKQIEQLSQGCSAVISCIGSIGTPNDQTVNSATGLAVAGAKAAGVDRFVYISVAPEVKEWAQTFEFLKPYMVGKSFSMDAVTSNFGSNSILIEPTFIHGGDKFQVNPPRVAGFYGSFIEGLLSSGFFRAAANIAPEGFIKIALEPPISVDVVASAAVAGALGKAMPVLDTYDKIQQAAASL